VTKWTAPLLGLILLAGAFARAPLWAQSEMIPGSYSRLDTTQGEVQPAFIGMITEATHLEHLLHIDFKHLMALATGLGIGHTIGELFFEGTQIGYLALMGGVMIGDWWYKQQMWPFLSLPPPGHGGHSGQGGAWAAGTVFRDCPQCPELVVIPAGRFQMGSPEAEPGRDRDEGPPHQVTISAPFALGRHEVTFEEWDACVADGGCSAYRPAEQGWGGGRQPVMSIGLEDALTYTRWLGRKTGYAYRLPSEAEWEYAARAGTSTPFSTGMQITADQANFNAERIYNGSPTGSFRRRPLPVGSFPPNPFGLHDIHGNLQEWVSDCWHDSYRGAPTDGAAWMSDPCSGRVLRGGTWSYGPRSLRSANRNKVLSPAERGELTGFRIARELGH